MTIFAVPAAAVGSLRQRLVDDMTLRRFSRETQRNYIRNVGRLATFLRCSPDTATVDDLRRFQIAQQEVGLGMRTINAIVSALRFVFVHTIERLDLACRRARMSSGNWPWLVTNSCFVPFCSATSMSCIVAFWSFLHIGDLNPGVGEFLVSAVLCADLARKKFQHHSRE